MNGIIITILLPQGNDVNQQITLKYSQGMEKVTKEGAHIRRTLLTNSPINKGLKAIECLSD